MQSGMQELNYTQPKVNQLFPLNKVTWHPCAIQSLKKKKSPFLGIRSFPGINWKSSRHIWFGALNITS